MQRETKTENDEMNGAEVAVKKTVTRATKARRQKEILRKLLKKRSYKRNELLEEAVKEYVKKYAGEENDVADLKGKFGSNFSLLEEAGEAVFDKATNTCFLNGSVEEEKKNLEAKKETRVKTAKKNAEEKATKEVLSQSTVDAEVCIDGGKEGGKTTKKSGEKKQVRTKKTGKKAEGTTENAAVVEEKEAKSTLLKEGEKAAATAEEEKRAAIEKSLKEAVEKAAAKKEKSDGAQKEKDEKPQEAEKKSVKAGVRKTRKAAEEEIASAEERGTGTTEKNNPNEEKTKESAQKAGDNFVPFGYVGRASEERMATVNGAKADRAEKATKKASGSFLTDFVFLGNTAKGADGKKGDEKAESKEETTKKTERATASSAERETSAKNEKHVEEESNIAKNAATNEANKESETKNVSARENVRKAGAKIVQGERRIARENGEKSQAKTAEKSRGRNAAVRNLTDEEQLKEEFLRKLRLLSGEYFEYYSVYLLERYSLKNGRRLEGMRVSGGKNDGGIDGEIELTDRFGFRETIYIQAKNWDPTKGVAEKWMIGETLIQQFVGAATCRQLKDGKRNCRGIFMTTSFFTKEAKEILSVLGEKFVGYDGDDIFEAAKECSFGVIKENGAWKLDEKLLEGDGAFFRL